MEREVAESSGAMALAQGQQKEPDDIKSLVNGAFVCQRWQNILCEPKLYGYRPVTADDLPDRMDYVSFCKLLQRGVRVLSIAQTIGRVQIRDPRSWEDIFPDDFKLKLRELELRNFCLSVRGISLILKHTHRLTTLIIHRCDLNHDCYQSIGTNEKLKHLHLTAIRGEIDAGGIEAMLAGAPRLETLYFTQTDLTEKAVDSLVELLPSSLLSLRVSLSRTVLLDDHILKIAQRCRNLIQLHD